MPTELEVAEGIRDGVLGSPQKLGTMELWAIRITGTGAAYRAGLKEYVWRSPEDYLHDGFLRRVNGLPVIWIHPEKVAKLNSEEFVDRVIGTCMLPYINGKEVWAIARIYDSEAIAAMKGKQYSTSPGVVFAKADGNKTFDLPDGETLLIEGVPSLLDHIAVVTNGVWDRGGDPSGILTTALTKGSKMTDAEKAEAARADAAKLDKVLDALGAVSSRLDSIEASRKDAEDKERDDKARRDAAEADEKAKTDKARRDAARKDRFGARKDSEAEEDFKKRFDADEDAARKDAMEEGCEETAATDRARKDRKDAETAEEARALEKANQAREDSARRDTAALSVENVDLKARLAQLEAGFKDITRETPAAERDALAAAQARADSVAGLFGDRVAAPMAGETSLAYRRRQLDRFKQYSSRFKESRFDSADASMVSAIEEIVYNDAATAARTPAAATAGILIPRESRDQAGRLITRFEGDPMAWMQNYMSQGAHGSMKQKGN